MRWHRQMVPAPFSFHRIWVLDQGPTRRSVPAALPFYMAAVQIGTAKTSRLVAIVDDDPSVLKALARLLRTRSFSATTYLSGTQFLDSLGEGLPDCLILD